MMETTVTDAEDGKEWPHLRFISYTCELTPENGPSGGGGDRVSASDCL
jgi:hypothetical protein